MNGIKSDSEAIKSTKTKKNATTTLLIWSNHTTLKHVHFFCCTFLPVRCTHAKWNQEKEEKHNTLSKKRVHSELLKAIHTLCVKTDLILVLFSFTCFHSIYLSTRFFPFPVLLAGIPIFRASLFRNYFWPAWVYVRSNISGIIHKMKMFEQKVLTIFAAITMKRKI